MEHNGNVQAQAQNHPMALEGVKGWVMVFLSLVFLLLYVLALFSLIPDLTDGKVKLLTHLEAVLFVIIGYYFGRVPGEQNEKTLRGQLSHEKQDAALERQGRATAENETATLRTKLTDVRATLAAGIPEAPKAGLVANLAGPANEQDAQTALRQVVAAALNILEQ